MCLRCLSERGWWREGEGGARFFWTLWIGGWDDDRRRGSSNNSRFLARMGVYIEFGAGSLGMVLEISCFCFCI